MLKAEKKGLPSMPCWAPEEVVHWASEESPAPLSSAAGYLAHVLVIKHGEVRYVEYPHVHIIRDELAAQLIGDCG